MTVNMFSAFGVKIIRKKRCTKIKTKPQKCSFVNKFNRLSYSRPNSQLTETPKTSDKAINSVSQTERI